MIDLEDDWEDDWEDDPIYEVMLSQMLSETFESISTRLGKNLPNVQQRLEEYSRTLDQEFPILLDLKKDPTLGKEDLRELIFKRRGAFVATKHLMNAPLMLYALELNGLAIVELHGFLERFLVRDVPKLLARSKKDAAILRKHLFKKISLATLAELLRDLKIWDENDLTFVHELSGLRNAIAHKNIKTLSYILQLKKSPSVFDIDSIMAHHNCIPHMIRTIHLFNKLIWYLKTNDLIDNEWATETEEV